MNLYMKFLCAPITTLIFLCLLLLMTSHTRATYCMGEWSLIYVGMGAYWSVCVSERQIRIHEHVEKYSTNHTHKKNREFVIEGQSSKN